MIMSADQTLQNLRESLNRPSLSPTKPKQQPQESTTIADALLKTLPEVAMQLKLLQETKQQEVDALAVISQLDFDIKQIASLSKQNMKSTETLNNTIATRLTQIDRMDIEWRNLINRISAVLDELEAVLKQL
jgi:hypothetical protein